MTETPNNGKNPKRNPNLRGHLRHGLKAGQLPDGCKYVELRLNKFRRYVEDCVIAAKGEVSLTDAAYIQSAMRWERHGVLAQRWLKQNFDKMTHADKLRFSREIADASDKRDKAIRNLNLDYDRTQDVLADLYAKPRRIAQ